MERRVVITGIGIVAPKSLGVNEFWCNLEQNKILYDEIPGNHIRNLGIKFGGQIDFQLPNEKFKNRFINKCDNFSIFALHAIQEAIEDSKLNLSSLDRERIGIYVGNSAGGWKSAEEGLYNLHKSGVKAISPYLASNWFPAAPQGHASINFGIKGHSKTVTADMASSSIAIRNAYNLIKNKRADFMLAGGTENILVPWGIMFYKNNGVINCTSTRKDLAYQPFSDERQGIVLADGSAFLVLEELSHAKARGAHIYSEIVGVGLTNDGQESTAAEQYSRCILMSTQNKIPDVVFLNGMATKNEDDIEIEGINKSFKDNINKIKFTCPKAFYGHSYGAAAAMDVVLACCSMENNKILKSGLVSKPAKNVNFDLMYSNHSNHNINSCLIISRGLGGINSSIFLSKENI